MSDELVVIGRLEYVHFREYSDDDEQVIAKIDTGADSGALHVFFERIEKDDDSKEWLVYQPIDANHKVIRTDRFEKIIVRSSNGSEEERHRIETTITLKAKDYPISLTLTNRSEMTYEVIIGHKFLSGLFLVDVSQENI